MRPPGVVYLVGAGPGDPELITLKGARLLSSADVVVYDRLVDAAVLALAPNAQLVDAGKSATGGGEGQAEINELLVREARQGRVVVRLKGGDPFVFGRGGEECEALSAAGVPFEVVSGVTSAVAAPAAAGIPLTHRQRASWVALATGHEQDPPAQQRFDWEALARADTAVFLMPVRNLDGIAKSLMSAGRDPATPAAVIASATLPSERIVRSALGEIALEARNAGITSPAVLVVGDVVSVGDSSTRAPARPLWQKRVFVARTREQTSKLSSALRDLGAWPLEFPAIRIEPEDPAALDAALRKLSSFAWVIFTSANSVEIVQRRLWALELDARALAASRIAGVGAATVERLTQLGVRADLTPHEYTSAALGEAMPPGPGRVLLPRAAAASRDLPRILGEKGWDVDEIPIYRTVADDRSVAAGREALDGGVDAVCFTSGSTVRSFVELWGSPPRDALVCCIGPVTASVAGELGIRVDSVASDHSIEGLVAALVGAVGG